MEGRAQQLPHVRLAWEVKGISSKQKNNTGVFWGDIDVTEQLWLWGLSSKQLIENCIYSITFLQNAPPFILFYLFILAFFLFVGVFIG